MSSSLRRSRLVAPTAIALAIAAACCDDPYTGPASHLTPPPAVAYEPQVTMFVGDTVNIGDLILLADGGTASCVSGDETIATVHDVVDIVGEAAGEVSMHCTRMLITGDPSSDETELDQRFYDYDVHVRVRLRETADDPALWWDGVMLPRSR